MEEKFLFEDQTSRCKYERLIGQQLSEYMIDFVDVSELQSKAEEHLKYIKHENSKSRKVKDVLSDTSNIEYFKTLEREYVKFIGFLSDFFI